MLLSFGEDGEGGVLKGNSGRLICTVDQHEGLGEMMQETYWICKLWMPFHSLRELSRLFCLFVTLETFTNIRFSTVLQ